MADQWNLSNALGLARDQLGYQLAGVDALDAKIGGFFGVGSTLAGILVALMALRPGFASKPGTVALEALTVLTWLILAVASCFGLMDRAFRFGPDPHDQARYAANNPRDDAQAYALKTTLDNFSVNRSAYRRKVLMLRLSSCCLLLETGGLLGVGFLFLRG